MQIAVIGAGWVGVTTATVLADLGHTVMCADLDAERITKLNAGEVPFFEPGLFDLLAQALSSGRLTFTSHNADAIAVAEIVFCCVDTPTDIRGVANLKAVFSVTQDFAAHHANGAVFVIKSTVPAGTAVLVRQAIDRVDRGAGRDGSSAVASSPEFLAESTAILDALTPSRIVIGADEPTTIETVKRVYEQMIERGVPVFTCTNATAEVIKTASNSFLATRISFMNEIANYCQLAGADPIGVAAGMGLDPRIGSIRPGAGYGGGCFPKDVQALLSESERVGSPLTVLRSAHEANYRQRVLLFDRLSLALEGVRGKRIAVFGLAFKPKTDDVRDAPALTLIDHLLAEGAHVVAYDPEVKPSQLVARAELEFASSGLDAARDADAVVFMCEWQEFQALDLNALRQTMRGRVFLDARYIWSRQTIESVGFTSA